MKSVSTKPRKTKLVKIVGIVVAFIISVVLLGYLSLWITFNGGISGTIRNFKSAPDPKSKTIAIKRRTAIEEINTSFDELEGIVGFEYYETSTYDRCSKGDSNYKRTDGYAYRCSYRTTRFYGFNGDFRQQMIDFEEKIINIGWKPPSYAGDSPMKQILEEYYDEYYGTGKLYYPKGYFVSNLPSPYSYERDREALDINYAERQTTDFILIESVQEVDGGTYDEIFNEESFQNISSVIEKITRDNDYVLVISIQKNYFQN